MTESLQVTDEPTKMTPPDIFHRIAEDQTPMNNIFAERQMCLTIGFDFLFAEQP